jgi:hypothetical protein
MFDLVSRKVVELGEYNEQPLTAWPGHTTTYQWLTFDCGHKQNCMVDLAAWRVGADCYCSECEVLKKEFRAEITEEFKRKLEEVIS